MSYTRVNPFFSNTHTKPKGRRTDAHFTETFGIHVRYIRIHVSWALPSINVAVGTDDADHRIRRREPETRVESAPT